jgi:4'-phosphopantetheinyl transferase
VSDEDCLDVWIAKLEVSGHEAQEFEKLLSNDELARADRFRSAKLRASFTAGRGLLRQLLARYGVGEAKRICFGYTERGKPFLPGSDLRFNAAHSESLFACAVVRGAEVGIDIERVRSVANLEGISRRFFAKCEAAALESLPAELRHSGFYRCWTRKEAFVKAIAAGLSLPLDNFAVPLDDAGDLQVAAPESLGGPWRIYPFEPEVGYAGAVVVGGPRRRVSFRRLSSGRSD